jgi:hypothetical protein
MQNFGNAAVKYDSQESSKPPIDPQSFAAAANPDPDKQDVKSRLSCKQCGSPFEPEARFCMRCGVPVFSGLN